MQIPRPTPTCTRFQPTIEMACSKCGGRMRLVLIQPQDRNFELLTYQCGLCDSGESFLMAYSGVDCSANDSRGGLVNFALTKLHQV